MQMILDKKILGTLDQGAGCLEVFEEVAPDMVYPTALEIVESMGRVVDTLFTRSQKILSLFPILLLSLLFVLLLGCGLSFFLVIDTLLDLVQHFFSGSEVYACFVHLGCVCVTLVDIELSRNFVDQELSPPHFDIGKASLSESELIFSENATSLQLSIHRRQLHSLDHSSGKHLGSLKH